MPLNPGNQTLIFNPPSRFVKDQYHTVPASTGLSSFTMLKNSSIQPITVKDKVDDTAYSEATDKVFTPYNTNTAAVEAEWYIVDSNGDQYRVLGNKNVPDHWGRFYQCEFIVKQEEG